MFSFLSVLLYSQDKAMPLDGHCRLDENISAATLSLKLWIKAADGGKATEFAACAVDVSVNQIALT